MLIDVVKNNDKISITGTKKVLTFMIRDKRFKKSLKNVIEELNEQLVIFIEANGHKVEELQDKNIDLNETFSENKHFNEFMDKYFLLQQSIENAQYISENPIYIQRKIEGELKDIKDLNAKLYPEHKPKHKVVDYGNIFFSTIKKIFLAVMLFIIFVFLLGVGYILVQELLYRI